MNVLVLTTCYRGEYAGECIHTLAKNLVRIGHGVSVLMPNRSSQSGFEEIDGVKVRRFNYVWPKALQRMVYGSGMAESMGSPLSVLQMPLLMLFFVLHALRHGRRADVIHCQWAFSAVPGLLVARILGKPVICTFHGAEVYTGRFRPIVKIVAESVDYLTFNSTYTRDRTLSFARPKRHAVIPPVTLSPDETGKADPQLVRKKLGLPADSRIILCLGRLVERKGVEYLVRAMSLLADEGNTYLLIGGDGHLRDDLKALIGELGLRDRALLLGRIPDDEVGSYFWGCDLLAVPSIVDGKGDTEGFGLVLVEAGLYSKPVVASRVGGIVDIVQDGVNGFLVAEKDPDQLAVKIRTLLVDGGLRERMGQAGRRIAEGRFNPLGAAAQTAGIYEETLKRKEKA